MSGDVAAPSDLSAEETLLGLLLVGNSLDAVSEIVGAGDFYRSSHRIVWDAMGVLRGRGEPVEANTVLAELERTRKLEAVGGSSGLHDLVRSAGNAIGKPVDYARRVAETSTRRALADLGAEASKQATDAASIDAALADLSRRLDGLALRGRPGGIRIADVKRERIRWLWKGRIPRGKLTVLDGDPGLGKSTLLLDLAARVTVGGTMPDGQKLDGPEGVVLLTAEDGLADTVRPRLEAAGANLELVYAMDTVPDPEHGTRELEIPTDVATLERQVRDANAALVIVDPLTAFLSTKTNSWRDQDVRRALRTLSEMAERTGCAVVVLRHLTKQGGSNPLYRGGGSIGIIGAARSGLLVAPDPADEHRRVLASTKSNLGPEPPALSYGIVSWPQDPDVSCVKWLGESRLRAADLVGPSALTPERQAILEAVRDAGEPLGPQQIADLTGLDHGSVKHLVRKLEGDGDLDRVSYGKYDIPAPKPESPV